MYQLVGTCQQVVDISNAVEPLVLSQLHAQCFAESGCCPGDEGAAGGVLGGVGVGHSARGSQ